MTNDMGKMLGELSQKRIAAYLREIGDEDAAERFEAMKPGGQSLSSMFGNDAWAHTGMILGFIPPEAVATQAVDIQSANSLAPDPSLRNTRVKVALERFWVHSYPGFGTHKVMCEFLGKNQIQGGPEELKFALATEVADGSAASISGASIFLGASVGENGIDFEGQTINVGSSVDDELLGALGGSTFRNGLTLLTAAQPAIKPFVGLTSSLVTAILKRSQNRRVFSFRLGLDFAQGSTSACLRHGSYIIVQGSPSGWNWADWRWNPSSHDIERRSDGARIGFNYLIFRVSPYSDAQPT